jgi:hypothetical protein
MVHAIGTNCKTEYCSSVCSMLAHLLAYAYQTGEARCWPWAGEFHQLPGPAAQWQTMSAVKSHCGQDQEEIELRELVLHSVQLM